MKRVFLIPTMIFLMAFILNSVRAQQEREIVSGEAAKGDSVKQENSTEPFDRIIATYFHGDRRCATCRKLEAYSREALETGFAEELGDSTLVWRTVNYDRAENKHFLKDYGLFTKALVLSRTRSGEEVGWKNLDKIWELVRNKEDFIKYVQGEMRGFIDSSGSHE